MDKFGSDLDTCAQCNATLTDHEAWICTACNERAINDYNPSDHELTRNQALLHRFWTHGASALLFPVLCLIVAGVSMVARDAQAQDTGTTLVAPHAINGRIYEWPYIGNPQFSRSCHIVAFWEDGSARAWCDEDGTMHVFDPKDHAWDVVDDNA